VACAIIIIYAASYSYKRIYPVPVCFGEGSCNVGMWCIQVGKDDNNRCILVLAEHFSVFYLNLQLTYQWVGVESSAANMTLYVVCVYHYACCIAFGLVGIPQQVRMNSVRIRIQIAHFP
jgi:hypothetical protein